MVKFFNATTFHLQQSLTVPVHHATCSSRQSDRLCNPRSDDLLPAQRASRKQDTCCSATCFEAEVLPRQSSLPESWDAGSLDDEAISKELHRLQPSQRQLIPRTLCTQAIRSHRNQRLRVRSRSAVSPGTNAASPWKSTLGVKPGKHLSAEQQAKLCHLWQEWKRVHECMPESANSAAQHKREWAKAAQLSVEQLERVETEGPLAAKLLLASVERLLYKISMKYVRQGTELDDVLAEARNLWLDAAAACDNSKASLTSFGVLYVRQRLPRTIDRQRSLLAQPPSSLYDELRVVRTREEIESSNIARQASVAEIAKKAGMTKSNVQNVLNRLKNTVSLDAPVANVETNNDEDRTLADNLVGAQGEETGEGLGGYLRMEMERSLEHLMTKNIKNEDERNVCELYYGFDGKPSSTLREISKVYDISVETVRKRLMKARAHLNKNGDLEKRMGPYIEDGFIAESASEETAGHVQDFTSQSHGGE